MFLSLTMEDLPSPWFSRMVDRRRAGKQGSRLAIPGTGDLSHDPKGPHAGWIDEQLDRSVLNALSEGEPEKLSSLYLLDSDTYHGGTGEIRNWLAVGGAMAKTKAKIGDYMANIL